MTDPATASLLRLQVARLRRQHRRRRFDPVVHVGRLDGEPVRCPVPSGDPVLDAGTRVEVVTALLDGACQVSPLSVWLTRVGEPSVQDDDLAWLAASSLAFGAAGFTLESFWAVTPTGWVDVRTGEGRSWKRLRV